MYDYSAIINLVSHALLTAVYRLVYKHGSRPFYVALDLEGAT